MVADSDNYIFDYLWIINYSIKQYGYSSIYLHIILN